VELDDQIVALCQKGRPEGFARLLLAYQERVYRRAYSFVHNREDALDLTQEVFLKVMKSIGNFTAGRPLWPWLRRIVTNLCLNFLRGRLDLLSLDGPDGPPEPAGGEDPADAAIAAWNWGQVQVALGRLPPLWRMAVVLRHQEGLSYDEVAHALELPIGTVKTYLFRARRSLRDLLAGEVNG
jgi:RNA polymerase sigma-70 factor, ECF subfamily